ncbi:unnamed protein product, partial [Cyprideis torosa]
GGIKKSPTKRKGATAPSVSPTKKMKSVFSAANLVFPSPLSTNNPKPPFLTSTMIKDDRARSPEKRDARPTPSGHSAYKPFR